jgi:spore coat protein CotH
MNSSNTSKFWLTAAEATLKEVFRPKLLAVAIVSALVAGCGGESSSDASATNTSETASTGTVVINEIVAKDASGGSDWIELYVTEGSVNLSDYTLVDDDPSHTAQALPSQTLSAGDYVVFAAIDENDTPPEDGNYVLFKLGSSDAVTLAKDGVSVSILSWEDGMADIGYSYGLLPDGTGAATTLTPTRGSSNSDTADSSSVNTVSADKIVSSFPSLVINEIAAKDTTTGYDWIELYAAGDSSVYLGDYRVRDEDSTTTYTLPAVTLAPGEHFIVYATDETLLFTDTVAFKLGASDSVSLYKGDDLIDTIKWDKGDALNGFSYGHFPDGSGGLRTLTPTINTANAVALRGPLVINEIVAKAADGGNDWIELLNNSDTPLQLNLYQIVDDSGIDPISLPERTLQAGERLVIYATGEASGSDTVAFKLGSSDSVSLMLNDETVDYLQWDDSDAPQGFSFGSLTDGSWSTGTLNPTLAEANQEATAFTTDTVAAVYIEISEEDWNDMITNALDEEEHPASITYQGITLENVAIRTKGNSSLSSVANSGSERFSFKVDMNEYVDGQKLLNLKKINLNNNFKDPSYLRETIAYNLMRELEVPAPRTAFVNLYINGALHGLYTMVEQVDSEFLERHFDNADGDLYKPDATDVVNGVGNDLKWIDDQFASYSAIELKTNEDSTDNLALIDFLDKLNNGTGNTTELASVLDAESVLRYLAVSTVLGNLDSYQGALAHNYYIYENSNQFSVIPWDFNESFGTFSMGCSANEMVNLFIDEPTSAALADRPLIAKLLSSETYRASYHQYIAALITGGMHPDNLSQTISSLASLIRESVYTDPTAFYTPAEFETALTSDVGATPGLLSFATQRVNSVLAQLDGSLAASGNGLGSCTSTAGGFPGGGMPGNGQPNNGQNQLPPAR